MSWHLCAYTLLLGTTADTDVPALSDDILTIVNNHFQLRSAAALVQAAAMSATLSRCRIDSPTTRFYGRPQIRPLIVGVTPPTNPNVLRLLDRPYNLPPGEEIAIQATSAIAMGTERFTALLKLMKSRDPLEAGMIFPVRFTSAVAVTANAWTTITYTMDIPLPSGQYQMVVSEHQSANAIAHRWLFDDQIERPGFLSLTALANRMPDENYRFQYGGMGRFYNTNMPRLQVLANGADAAHEGYMWVIHMGGGPRTF